MKFRTRLELESLDSRDVPALFTPADAPGLIEAINSAGATPEADVISLAAGARYTLTAVNNTEHGPTGLPVVAAGSPVTIRGNGATIERGASAPAFRLLDVSAGATLTLENLTLQGGWAYGTGTACEGGAVFNRGSLGMRGVTLQDNTAQGGSEQWAAMGGGIYSEGTLTLDGGTVRNNRAIGAPGLDGYKTYNRFLNGWVYRSPTDGGDGLGGGLYLAGGAASFQGVSVTGNTATGGPAGKGKGGASPGAGVGGGLYIGSDAAVALDVATSVTGNTAATSGANIFRA